jgi:RimJ/RimL family protein N-acetyltransferase
VEPVKDPLLLDLPERIETRRLVLRTPRPGDGPIVNEAVLETIEALQRWMAWSVPTPTVEQSEQWCRKAAADFIARKRLAFLSFSRQEPAAFVGSNAIHAVDWDVPRFEIGYWVRRRQEGQGYVTEAATALARFAFEALGARRVEIRMDDRNERSWRVAERLGFRLEGVLRNECREAGKLRDTRVYAVTEASELTQQL